MPRSDERSADECSRAAIVAPMANWLLKSEPSTYSFEDLVRDGSSTWDGITNNTALMHLRTMKAGDHAFLYHTGDEKQVVGIARIASAPYADPKLKDPKLVVVDVAPVKKVTKPVTLAAMKSNAKLKDFDLLRITRLSVVPVSDAHWGEIMRMAGM